jgi:hypothetical protein
MRFVLPVICVCLFGGGATAQPRPAPPVKEPPQAPPVAIYDDVATLKREVAELKAEVARLKAARSSAASTPAAENYLINGQIVSIPVGANPYSFLPSTPAGYGGYGFGGYGAPPAFSGGGCAGGSCGVSVGPGFGRGPFRR